MVINGREAGAIRLPFTPSQWQELEHQALIFKYILSGVPIPPQLLFFTLTSSSSSSSSSRSFGDFAHPSVARSSSSTSVGWRCFEMGRKIDSEPGRCRRTDGKKWRCSKEVFHDSKYCEKHMHRGKNRSRKSVEMTTSASKTTSDEHHHLRHLPVYSKPVSTTTTTHLVHHSSYSHHSRYDSNIIHRNDHPTVYRFLEEGPPEKKDFSTASWLKLDDKSSTTTNTNTTTTQLSISIPEVTSHHHIFPILSNFKPQNHHFQT